MYVIHCPDGPSLDMPLTIDPTGVYCRREGFSGHYICGASPAGVRYSSLFGFLEHFVITYTVSWKSFNSFLSSGS